MRQIYISLTIGADFVPLVPLSMPVSCPLCRVPRRFRAARAAFHAGCVPLVPPCHLLRRFRAACAAFQTCSRWTLNFNLEKFISVAGVQSSLRSVEGRKHNYGLFFSFLNYVFEKNSFLN